MSFQSQLVADAAAIFVNEWAASITLRARGATTGGTVCSIVIGDPDPTMVQISAGVEDRREAQICIVTTVASGILSRSLERGDQVVVGSGAFAGTWIISRCQADVGGLTTATAVLADLHAPGASQARELR